MAAPIVQLTATIAASGNLSGAVATPGGLRLIGVVMPAAWDAAGMTFQGSIDGSTYQDMQTASAELSLTVAAGKTLDLTTPLLTGVSSIKVRSGTSGTPVTQTAQRVITLLFIDTLA